MPVSVAHINLSRGFRGGERQTELLIRELAERGITQRAVLRPGSPLMDRLADVPGLKRNTLGTPWLPRPRLLDARLLHAHEARAAHLAHLTHRLTGRPYLVTRRARESPGTGWLTRGLYRRAAVVVAISRAVASTLRAHDPAMTTRIINSAAGPLNPDPSVVARLRSRWRGRFVVGHVGAMVDRHKGQLVLIRAARRLAPVIPELKVVLLGEGPDEGAIRAAARGCEVVELEGFVTDVGSYLAAFDAFAFPSRYEALGSILLDALTAGLPCVASNVDGIPEIIRHDREGLLVPPGDAEALADAILALYRDPAARRRYSETARDRSRQYNAGRMADRYLALYQSIVPGVFE